MIRTCYPILTLLLVASIVLSGESFAQNYVHYATLRGHRLGAESLAFSPDGRTLASGGFEELFLWDTATGIRKATLVGQTSSVENVVFSPDGRTLTSSGVMLDDGPRLWDAISGVHLKTLISDPIGVDSMVFSPDGRTLAAGGYTDEIPNAGKVVLWDVGTRQHRKTLTGHTLSVYSLAFSPDSRTLASKSFDGTIRLWDANTGQHRKTLKHSTGMGDSTDVVFSPDGRTIASGGWQEIRLWDANTGKHKGTLTGDISNNVHSTVFSPDGRTIAGASHLAHLWDANTRKHKKTLKRPIYPKGPTESVIFSPDGHTLAGWTWWGTNIYLWNPVTGAHLQILTGHTNQVNIVKFSPDGNLLVSCSRRDKTICLWKLTSSRPANPNSPTPTKSANQVYNNAIRAVMWIVNPGISEGSGVLIDKQYKLAITNTHVIGTQNRIDVYFPAPDENGEIIKDRNFYLKNSEVLKRLGYYTKGHVVAKDEKADLAIIRLDGLPETAREIDWNFTTPTTNTGDLVYILGNPGGQDLWRWTLGEFLNDHGDFLHIQSDVFGGNSGGPVLNKQGILLGIIVRSDRHMNALAIPARDINRLLSESRLEHSRSHR